MQQMRADGVRGQREVGRRRVTQDHVSQAEAFQTEV